MSIKGATELQRRLAAISDTKKVLGEVAQLGVAEAKALVPRRTGSLARSIRVGNVSEDRAQVVAGGSRNVGYARYVEQGTGLYGPRHARIVPKRAKVLSWVGGGSRLTGRGKGSRRIFARSVAGRKATPYLLPGVKRALEKAGLSYTIIAAWNDAA
jgi:hypothetical protein